MKSRCKKSHEVDFQLWIESSRTVVLLTDLFVTHVVCEEVLIQKMYVSL